MKAKVIVLPGSGGGAEILTEAVRVLDLVANDHGHELTFELAMLESTARTVELCRGAAGVLVGPATAEAKELGILRQELGLFAMVSPLRVAGNTAESPRSRRKATGFDVLVVSEHPDAADKTMDTTARTQRVVRAAARLAHKRWSLVTHVDSGTESKAALAGLDMASEFPGVTLKQESLDVAARTLSQSFSRYDVLVGPRACTEWLVQGALTAGAAQPAAAAYLGSHETFGVYQAVDTTVSSAGAVIAAAMMLRYSLNLGREATAIETAISKVLNPRQKNAQRPTTPREMGDAICAFLSDGLNSSQAV